MIWGRWSTSSGYSRAPGSVGGRRARAAGTKTLAVMPTIAGPVMRHWALLILLGCGVAAGAPVELVLRNPSELPRIDVVSVRLDEVFSELPGTGGLQVVDADGSPVPSQLDDLDLSGDLSAEDELAFLVSAGAYETVTVTIRPGDARLAPAQWVAAGGLDVEAGGYRASIAEDGGWLRNLQLVGDPGVLVSSLSQCLRSGGFSPEVVFRQQGLKAEIARCDGPLRQVVVARYDLDQIPFSAPEQMPWAGELRSGYRGEVVYCFYHDYVAITHRLTAGAQDFPVETCEVEAVLPMPGAEPSVLSRWSNSTGKGAIPAMADLTGPGWRSGPDLVQCPFVDFAGPSAGLAVVYEAETTGAAELSDGRAEKARADCLRYTRSMDSAESTMWMVPHRTQDDVSDLIARLSNPMIVENAAATALAELMEARGVLNDLSKLLAEARRGESFVTPAEVQLQACEHLLAMAEVCARNRREVQACRLALEVAERASGARSFLADSQERKLRPPDLGRDGEVLLGVCFTGRGRDFPRGYRRSLERLRRYGVDSVHDTHMLCWAACEPRRGEIDLSRPDRYFDLLQELGLRYLPCIDPWHEVPKWVPSPDAEALAERYLEQVLLRYRSHEAALAWVVRHEPTTWGREPGAADVGGFRDWLMRRYATVDALNRAWDVQYARFSDVIVPPAVEAPRVSPDQPLAPAPEAGAAAAAHDAALYGMEAMLGELRDLSRLVKKLDPGRPAVVKSLDAMPSVSPAVAGDPWLLKDLEQPAYCHDFFYVPASAAVGGLGDYRLSWAFSTAVERSAVGDRPIWCTEWNQQWWGPGFPKASRSQVRLMTWTAVAEGLRGVFAYSYPSGKWPVGNFDDSPLPVLEEYGVLSAETQALGPLLNQSQPAAARVGIYWPRESLLHSGGAQGQAGPTTGPAAALRSLWESLSVAGHYPVKFCADPEVLSSDLFGYEALVLTGATFLQTRIAERLVEYVRGGGTLVVLGPCGVYDTNARMYDPPPAAPLRDLMGARLTAVRTGVVSTDKGPITGTVPVCCYEPEAPDLEAKAHLASGQELAAFARNVGAGRVIVCGAELGAATDAQDGAGRRWLIGELQKQGIEAPIRDEDDGARAPHLYARLLQHAGRGHLLLANLTATARWCRLALPADVAISEGPVDLLTGTPAYPAPGHAVDVYLAADDVRWVCL